MAISGAMVATGNPRLRRAAARGMGSVAVASLLANQLGKRVLPRARPLLSSVPGIRIAHRVPVSSSFPSGHSASAAAFAVGAAIEAPWLAAPVGGLAAAVAFSRVYTGVHFPSDVLAGVALGAVVAGVGGGGGAAHHSEPSRAGQEPRSEQPRRPDGHGLIAVVNPSSGTADDRILAVLTEQLPAAEVIVLTEGDDVRAVLEAAAARAEVLGVAGGDGTINCGAAIAMAADIPLLVIPAGTFNHFAKDLDLNDVEDSVGALAEGTAIRIDVGDVDGEPFLNTASLGSYPEFVKIRERWEARLGKPVAAAIAMILVLRRCPPLSARVNGVPRELRLLFVGNNDYQPRGFVPRWRPSLATGRLDVRLVDSTHRATMLRLIGATLTGDFYKTTSYLETRCQEFSVDLDGDAGSMARDGEVCSAPATVRFTVRRQALTVFRGRPSASR